MDQEAKRELVQISVVGAMTQAIAHWFPWHRLGHEMRPPLTYVIGVGQIVGWFSVWAFRRKHKDDVTALGAIVASSGLSVIAAYAIDYALGLYQARELWGEMWVEADRKK